MWASDVEKVVYVEKQWVLFQCECRIMSDPKYLLVLNNWFALGNEGFSFIFHLAQVLT